MAGGAFSSRELNMVKYWPQNEAIIHQRKRVTYCNSKSVIRPSGGNNPQQSPK
jgi:hypothetical protein